MYGYGGAWGGECGGGEWRDKAKKDLGASITQGLLMPVPAAVSCVLVQVMHCARASV
jgi:hypothetical protein